MKPIHWMMVVAVGIGLTGATHAAADDWPRPARSIKLFLPIVITPADWNAKSGLVAKIIGEKLGNTQFSLLTPITTPLGSAGSGWVHHSPSVRITGTEAQPTLSCTGLVPSTAKIYSVIDAFKPEGCKNQPGICWRFDVTFSSFTNDQYTCKIGVKDQEMTFQINKFTYCAKFYDYVPSEDYVPPGAGGEDFPSEFEPLPFCKVGTKWEPKGTATKTYVCKFDKVAFVESLGENGCPSGSEITTAVDECYTCHSNSANPITNDQVSCAPGYKIDTPLAVSEVMCAYPNSSWCYDFSCVQNPPLDDYPGDGINKNACLYPGATASGHDFNGGICCAVWEK